MLVALALEQGRTIQVEEVGLEWLDLGMVEAIRVQVVGQVVGQAQAWAVEGRLQELVVELELVRAQVGVAVQGWVVVLGLALELAKALVWAEVAPLAAVQGLAQALVVALEPALEVAQEQEWAQVRERGQAMLVVELPSQEPSCFRSWRRHSPTQLALGCK